MENLIEKKAGTGCCIVRGYIIDNFELYAYINFNNLAKTFKELSNAYIAANEACTIHHCNTYLNSNEVPIFINGGVQKLLKKKVNDELQENGYIEVAPFNLSWIKEYNEVLETVTLEFDGSCFGFSGYLKHTNLLAEFYSLPDFKIPPEPSSGFLSTIDPEQIRQQKEWLQENASGEESFQLLALLEKIQGYLVNVMMNDPEEVYGKELVQDKENDY
jgi:hypothetical protein